MQNMQLWQAVALGALQGVAELFPISSLAQTILIPALLGWSFDQSEFLAFVVALHLATAVALVVYFWRDWLKVIAGFAGCFKYGKLVYDKESKFAWLLVAGTVVVGAVGLVAEKKLRVLFEDPSRAWMVGCILVFNGFIMLFGDYMKRKSVQHTPGQLEHVPDLAMHAALVGHPVSKGSGSLSYEPSPYTKEAEDLSFTRAGLVGASQTFALLPGISRSGVTMVAGLFAGLTYEEASRFTFMLATPVIGLAALKKLPELIHGDPEMLHLAIWGSAAAFVAALASVAFLMRFFRHNRLTPFAAFCILFGLGSAVFLKYQMQEDLAKQAGVNSGSQVVHQNPPPSP